MNTSQNIAWRYVVSFFGDAAVTAVLFLLMVAMIHTSFTPKISPTIKFDRVENPEAEMIKELEIEKPVLKIKQASEKPESPNLSSPPPAKRPKADYIIKVRNPEIQPIEPSLELSQVQSLNRNSIYKSAFQGVSKDHGNNTGAGTGHDRYGASSTNGINQCTIGFTLGLNDQISGLFWSNCIDGDIANKAEQALYDWVRTKPDSFTRLNAIPGDQLEFTFERR